MKRLSMIVCFLACFTFPRAQAALGACTAATSTCSEWITLAGGPERSVIYTTYPLESRNPGITRALVVIC